MNSAATTLPDTEFGESTTVTCVVGMVKGTTPPGGGWSSGVSTLSPEKLAQGLDTREPVVVLAIQQLASAEARSLLHELKALDSSSRRKAVRRCIERVDHWLDERDFRRCGELLRIADSTELSVELSLALLAITSPARHEFPADYLEALAKTRRHLFALRGPGEAAALLRGLE